jgi:hypothetical protein
MWADQSPSSSFTLVCPGYRAAAGRLAFSVGAQLVAELDDTDLLESWQSAEELTADEAAELAALAGMNLSEILADGIDAADIGEAAAEAAVVFLLAMKRQGIGDPRRIPACSVMWSGSGLPERVMFSA